MSVSINKTTVKCSIGIDDSADVFAINTDVNFESGNDLENVVFKKYSIIKNLKYFISNLPNILFTRMTGSGSALVAYFKSKKSANYAAKVFKRKYKNYWYIVSKTI